MSYTIIVEERAKTDIREAAQWMAQYSPEKATLWHFDIEDAILSLEQMPNRCPRARESQIFKQEIRQLILGSTEFSSRLKMKRFVSFTFVILRKIIGNQKKMMSEYSSYYGRI